MIYNRVNAPSAISRLGVPEIKRVGGPHVWITIIKQAASEGLSTIVAIDLESLVIPSKQQQSY
jgi:hypothetical protein